MVVVDCLWGWIVEVDFRIVQHTHHGQLKGDVLSNAEGVDNGGLVKAKIIWNLVRAVLRANCKRRNSWGHEWAILGICDEVPSNVQSETANENHYEDQSSVLLHQSNLMLKIVPTLYRME